MMQRWISIQQAFPEIAERFASFAHRFRLYL